MRRLLIGPFELQFDHSNTNSTVFTEKLAVFDHYALKIKKSKNFKFRPPPYKYPHSLSSFHTTFITFSLSSSHTHNVFPVAKVEEREFSSMLGSIYCIH
jgi:hypothetical protein